MASKTQANPQISSLPNVANLSSLSQEGLTYVLDLLFEPSTELHALALPTMRHITFSSYAELIDTLRDELLTIQKAVHEDPAARKPLLSILGSHPRLGDKAAAAKSAQSAAEQARLNDDDGKTDTTTRLQQQQQTGDELAALNEEYEATFPGLRYVVFVNGRGRDVIVEDMRRRIARGDAAAEEAEAIRAMCDIAKDRASKLGV